MTGLLENERADIRRREIRRRMNNVGRPRSSDRRNYNSDNEGGALSKTTNLGKLQGISKFLGKVFEAKKRGENENDQKKLVFAGIKNNNTRMNMPR